LTDLAIKTRSAGRGSAASRPFDVKRVRADFPILTRKVHGRPLVYLDSAASAQKPRAVLEAMRRFTEEDYANVHRGVHFLSQMATDAFEGVREKVARFINAGSFEEIVFTRGTTEAINLVAASFGRSRFAVGDEVVISEMEHHANIVPWQLLREEKGIVLRVVPVDERGDLRVDELERTLGPRTRLVAITHASNVLGTITPAKAIVRMAHARGIPVLLDGAQAVVHGRVDVRDLDADFYCFSGHKLYGPTGIGVLYGKAALLAEMPPYQGGGEMIATVSFARTTFKAPPYRFEAGTPPIIETIGLGAAIDYLLAHDVTAVAAHERRLLDHATARLSAIPGLRIVGSSADKASIVSFAVEGVHAHDVSTILDRAGVAVRAGHHCAQPLMERFGVDATTRASFALYNTMGEVDALAEALLQVRKVFGL
jgi:cysteine desulfurase/selenocysteine lyase